MLDYCDFNAIYYSLYDMDDSLQSLGLDTDQLTTCLGCHWEMEKLDYHLDRLVQCLLENRVPKILALACTARRTGLDTYVMMVSESSVAPLALRSGVPKWYKGHRFLGVANLDCKTYRIAMLTS